MSGTPSQPLSSATLANPNTPFYGGGGGGGGGVTLLNNVSGDVVLSSSDSSVTITPSGQNINLQAVSAVNPNPSFTTVTTTGNATIGGAITVTGSLSSAGVTTGGVTASAVTSSGAISASAVTSSGAISAASANISGNISAGTLTLTTPVTQTVLSGVSFQNASSSVTTGMTNVNAGTFAAPYVLSTNFAYLRLTSGSVAYIDNAAWATANPAGGAPSATVLMIQGIGGPTISGAYSYAINQNFATTRNTTYSIFPCFTSASGVYDFIVWAITAAP